MPSIAKAQSAHIEGENIRTIARVVGLDQAMLTPDDVESVTVKIEAKGRLVYQREYDGGLGISAPTTPDGWNLRGLANFVWTLDAAELAVESPPFAFQGGQSYLIVYEFSTVDDGTVFIHHAVRILPSP